MINYFSVKNLLLFISVLTLSFFYQYIRSLFLKGIQLDPYLSTSLNIHSFYLGYTNYNLVKFLISFVGYFLYNILNIENV